MTVIPYMKPSLSLPSFQDTHHFHISTIKKMANTILYLCIFKILFILYDKRWWALFDTTVVLQYVGENYDEFKPDM